MSLVYNAFNNDAVKNRFNYNGRQYPINPFDHFKRPSKKNLYLGPGNDMPPVDPTTGLPSFKGKPEWHPRSQIDSIAFNHDVQYGLANKYQHLGHDQMAKFVQRQADKLTTSIFAPNGPWKDVVWQTMYH